MAKSKITRAKLLEYCLAKPGARVDEPWEGETVVKVGNKIFAFLGREPEPGAAPHISLKLGATREIADEWLVAYPADARVMSHIGRFGWNTLRAGGTIPDEEILEAIDASYDAVVAKLPRRARPN